MKHHLLGSLAASLALLFGTEVHAAQGSGTIHGRVFNSVTETFLERVRIAVDGTPLETFTDAGGYYRLTKVPAGQVKVTAFYTGFPPATKPVNLTAGETALHDIQLGSARAKTVGADGTVKLPTYVVATSREMDGAAIAINEQRFAANIVNVVAADEFGLIAEGSVGEFLKFLPGITVHISDMGDAESISLDGVPSSFVPISIGDFAMASAHMQSASTNTASRAIQLGQSSMHSVARVEVAYTPTPEISGGALAGSIKLVPRSAFERSKPVVNWDAYVMTRSKDHDIKKVPGIFGRKMRMVFPGFNFTYIKPVNNRFGFTLSAGMSTNFAPLQLAGATTRGTIRPTNGNAFPDTTPDRPYRSAVRFNDNMRLTDRSSIGLTFDYKLGSNGSLSLAFQYATNNAENNGNRTSFDILRVDSFSTNHTHSTVGGGNISKFGQSYVSDGSTYTPTLTYRHEGSIWHLAAGAGYSRSRGSVKDAAETGFFGNHYEERSSITVRFDDNSYLRPNTIAVTDGADAPLDFNKLSSYLVTRGNNNSRKNYNMKGSAFANARRDFFGAFPVSLKGGVDVSQQVRDARGENPTFTFVGADGRSGTADDNAAPFVDEVLSLRQTPYGFPQTEWASPAKLWNLYQAHPEYFIIDEVRRHTTAVNFSTHAEEVISSAYLRGDVQWLNRRLKLVGGVRSEQTNVKGEGGLVDPTRNFERDINGNIILLPNGSRKLLAPGNSVEAAQLTRIDRGARTRKEYLRWFPSLNASFIVKDNIVARAGYYWSVGRPGFAQYAGSLTLPNLDDPPAPNNRILVNNPSIKAWSAQTAKLSLEYYFEGVGQFSVGTFHREFENFFVSTVFRATPEFLAPHGLDPNIYGDYDVTTEANRAGKVRMTGANFNYKHALTFLPHWARGVQVFANGSQQRVEGDDNGDFDAIPRSGNCGISLSREKFSLRVNWSYRGKQRRAAYTGRGIEPGTYQWTMSQLYVDFNGEFRFRRNLSFFANARNLGDEKFIVESAGPSTPAHLRMSAHTANGTLWTIGMKGQF